MTTPESFRRALILYSVFLALGAISIAGWMLASPSEPGNAILFGLSLPRLILTLGLLLACVLFSLLAARSVTDKVWAQERVRAWVGGKGVGRALVWLGGISLGLGWTGLFLPSERAGIFEGYWLRIQPLMAFLLLTGSATLALVLFAQRRSRLVNASNAPTARLGAVLYAACLPVLVFMLVSRFGIASQDDFWYGAGVPILAQQLIVAIACGLLYLFADRKWDLRRFDPLVFLLLFVVTAFVWAREPLREGFSFIAHPPNNVLYPIFDPATYDTASQFPLIGERMQIFGSHFFERPLYLAFLFGLHLLFGQDYTLLMAAQAAVFAVFPALVFLIGRSLNVRPVGVAAALVAVLRGVNAIAASNMIDLANPKMILTDFPAAIGMALVTLAVCEWSKQPGGRPSSTVWAGGAFGFALMLRTNSLLVLGVMPLFMLFKFGRDWRKWLVHLLLVVLGLLAVTLPWELRNRSLGGQMYGSIVAKFKAVIDQRYTDPAESPPPLPINQNLRVLAELYTASDALQQADCNTVACFVPNHFLHNILNSVLVLPVSPRMADLRAAVRDDNPYWYPAWDGTFTAPALLLLLLNLFLISLGIGTAWKKTGSAGLAPLAVFLFYNLSNALARTSGGRYVVPMDWIVPLYFLFGLFQIILWIVNTSGSTLDLESVSPARADPSRPAAQPIRSVKLIPILALLTGFGSLLPITENIQPARYRTPEPRQILAETQPSLTSAGLDASSIEVFLQNDTAVLLIGRALFPRHYRVDEGHTIFYPNLPLPFPRMTFNLIGPAGQQGVILPGDIPAYFPHAVDALVIGCRAPDHVDALAVVVLDGKGAVYVRAPGSELTCPLGQPVCDNNSVCR